MVDGGGHRIGSARRLAAPAAAALAILLATSGAALALSGGAEIPVNTTTANSQTNPAIASGPDGGFTVAWQSFGH